MMIRKALIPIAGKGTRLMPVTSVVPKAMFPLIDSTDNIKAVLHVICEHAVSAGAQSVGIVMSPWQVGIVQRYFEAAREYGFEELPARIEYITQTSPKGFGDAVLQARNFVGDEPFMLLLGDHIHIPDDDKPACAAQVVEAFDSAGAAAMIGMQTISATELSKVGVAGGIRIQQDTYRCTCFVEKPDIDTARRKLRTDGLPKDTFLAHSGIYIFTPEIFECIEEVAVAAEKTAGEIELADAQSLLLTRRPKKYLLHNISGRAYDVGNPAGYAEAQVAFRAAGDVADA